MVTIGIVKASELKRWLKKNGCTFVEESRHIGSFLVREYRVCPGTSEETKSRDVAKHYERSRLEDGRTEMEPYLALFEPDRKAGGFVVTFPDFGYGVTQGETDEEAIAMAQDLVMLTISDYIRESKPLPAPRRHRGLKFRPALLPALQAVKV